MSGAGDVPVPQAATPAGPDADADGVRMLFRQAMTRLASGVVMVTCEVDGRPWGITATACCSISIDPPLILVSLKSSTVSAAAIERTRSFGVGLLGSRALDAAKYASRQGEPKFIDEYCVPSEASRTPIVRHSAAHVDCGVSEIHPAADHRLFIGDVRAVLLQPVDQPLVYCSQAYHGIDGVREKQPRA
jgi:flavin reductase ActVB